MHRPPENYFIILGMRMLFPWFHHPKEKYRFSFLTWYKRSAPSRLEVWTFPPDSRVIFASLWGLASRPDGIRRVVERQLASPWRKKRKIPLDQWTGFPIVVWSPFLLAWERLPFLFWEASATRRRHHYSPQLRQRHLPIPLHHPW